MKHRGRKIAAKLNLNLRERENIDVTKKEALRVNTNSPRINHGDCYYSDAGSSGLITRQKVRDRLANERFLVFGFGEN